VPSPVRLVELLGGCTVLGVGVALLLSADLGSDGFSTLVNGIALSTGMQFWLANLLVSAGFLLLAAVRGTYPGLGTVVQVLVVGGTVSVLLQAAMLALAMPVLAVGIAAYLGSHTGAGPAEALALAWDPPLPFRWSYSAVQLGGAVVGWLLGATIGPGTVLVVLLLGPLVDLASRLLRLDVHQRTSAPAG
jgi:uncharacterized membrane protein YczE